MSSLVNELRSTTSIKEKTLIVKRYETLHPFLEALFTSGPLFLTSKALDKKLDSSDSAGKYEFLEDFIEDLARRSISGHDVIRAAERILQEHPEHSDLLKCIIDKDLRIRMGPKLVLKAIGAEPAKLPIALAENLKVERARKYFGASLSRQEQWMVSRKLDGIRCLAICSRGKDGQWNVELKTRQGKCLSKAVKTIEAIKASLKNCPESEFILDGELCAFEDGLDSRENFRAAAAVVGSKVPDESELVFTVFDFISGGHFAERQRLLKEHVVPSGRVQILAQTQISSEAEFNALVGKSRAQGWEGLMLRRAASPHQPRRSLDLLKHKDIEDAEFTVTGYTLAPIRSITDGVECTEELLSSIKVEYKGRQVEVGSGFSMEERRAMREMGQGLIGRRVTVCYFSESQRKGSEEPSLRFPIFKCFRD